MIKEDPPVVITLEPELEAALNQAALRRGIAPELLVLVVLRPSQLPRFR